MLLVLTLIGLAISAIGRIGINMQQNSMSARDHRHEAQNLLFVAANDSSRSRIDKNYTQAMAHLRIADEMDNPK